MRENELKGMQRRIILSRFTQPNYFPTFEALDKVNAESKAVQPIFQRRGYYMR